MPHLQFSEEADAHHLNPGQDEDAGDGEDGAVNFHDVLTRDQLQNQEPHRHGCAGHHTKSTDGAEEVQRTGHVTEQEADGKQIEEDAEGAGDAVVGLPCCAGRIGDGDFADAGAVPGGEGGDEAMHLTVKGNVLDDFAAVGFEGGAKVVDVYPAENRHELIGDAGW